MTITEGRKRYIFKIQNPQNTDDSFDVYEWAETRLEAQEKVKHQYYEKDIIYIGRKDFDDIILDKAQEFLDDTSSSTEEEAVSSLEEDAETDVEEN